MLEGGIELSSRICDGCNQSFSTIYVDGQNRFCLECNVERSRKRYWANREKEEDMYGSVRAGPCFLCDAPAQYGVLRELSRDGNAETCPTWICWPCHTSIPKESTLYDFETPVAPLRGIDFPANEGVAEE